MGVHDGGACCYQFAHTCKVGTGSLQVVLIQQSAESAHVVGKLVGQAALLRVGIQQCFRTLLLQPGTVAGVFPLHHLFIEHLHDSDMHQHRHAHAKGEQHGHQGSGLPGPCDHQHNVQHHSHPGEKGHHQRLQWLQSTLLVPAVQGMRNCCTHDKVRGAQRDQAAGVLPCFAGAHSCEPGVGIVDRVLHQKAHGAVDQAGRELIRHRPTKQLRGNEQIQYIEQNGLHIEKGHFCHE